MFFQYLKYYVGPAMLATGYLGFVLGGYWLWLGFLTFPVLAMADTFFDRDLSTRPKLDPFWAYVPVWLSVSGALGLYIAFAFAVATHPLNGFQLFGGILSCAWLSAVPLVPAAHELYHQRGQIARTFGRYGHLCILDCTRDIAHAVGHHIDVATYKDGDTAPRGTNLYQFTGRAIFVSTRESFRMEAEALQKRGRSKWNIRHRMYSAIGAQVLFQIVIWSIGGFLAVAAALSAMLIARAWVEAFNYFQHYGVVRVEGAPIARHHLWNHLSPITRLAAFEITNHADHHINSYQPFWELVPHRESIEMPNVFACFLLSLVPPLWDRVSRPALKRWDQEWATPGELEVAKKMNLDAGWPDWFDDGVQARDPRSAASPPHMAAAA